MNAGYQARQIDAASAGDYDDLLAGLCYNQCGDWPTFERLARQVDAAAYFPLECCRLLASLGHIDVVLDPSTLRPVFWSVAQPALLPVSGEAAVLCGFRPDSLLERLASDVAALGGTLQSDRPINGPTVIRVCGLAPTELSMVAESVSQATNLGLLVFEDGPLGLALPLPRLSDAAAALPRRAMPTFTTSQLQRFDLAANKWRTVEESINEPGAYRQTTRPYRFFSTIPGPAGQLEALVADNRLAKWLAALYDVQSLMAYDSASSTLICRLGGQLPGLYERAAVLCSGMPPRSMSDSTVAYEGVAETVALALAERITT